MNRITYSNNRISKNKSRMPLDLYIKLGPYIPYKLLWTIMDTLWTVVITLLNQLLWETFHCDDNTITECNITDTYNTSTAYIFMYKLMEC